MTDANNPIFALLIEAVARTDRRGWSSRYDGQRVARNTAVEIVEKVLKEQISEPLPTAGPGIDFVLGQLCFYEYFSANPPSEAELVETLRLSEVDYYADLAVKLLQMLSIGSPTSALNEWEKRRYLGETTAPDKPPGPGRHKNLHRDNLLTGQIRELQNLGFKPTRSEATSDRNSGCDIVVDALQNNGLAMSYAAIEAIWKKAKNKPDLSLLAALWTEDISAKPSKMPSD